MGTDDLEGRIYRLELRLARLEAHLLTNPPAAPPSPAPAPLPPKPVLPIVETPPPLPPAPSAPAQPTPLPPSPPLRVTPEPIAESLPAAPTPRVPPLPSRTERLAALRAQYQISSSLQPKTVSYEPAAPAQPLRATTLERTLGLKWTAWVGALIFVIGAGLGIKFAYDQGWFAQVPPSVRLILWSLGAFTLLGIGEFVLRRVGRLASVGPFAAGIASLFLIAYAGHAYYGLYASTTAFFLMALAAALGAVVSARADLVSIAVVSLLGAHLAPLVIESHGDITRLLIYLVAIQVMALLLAGRGTSSRWWTLRGLSLAVAVLWTLALTAREGHVTIPLVIYAFATSLLGHLELGLTAYRGRARAEIPGAKLYSLLITAFPFAALWFHPEIDDIHFLLAAIMGWVTVGGLGQVLDRAPLPSPTGEPEADANLAHRRFARLSLSDSFRLQSLLILSVGLVMKFNTAHLPWPGLGAGLLLALFTAHRPADAQPRRRYSETFAVIFTLYSLGPLLLQALQDRMDIKQSHLLDAWLRPAVESLAAALIAQVAALFLARKNPKLGLLVSGTASGVFALSAALAGPSTWCALLLLAYAWTWSLLLLLRVRHTAPFAPKIQAYALLGVTSVYWLFFVAIGPRLSDGVTPLSPDSLAFFNLSALTGLLLIASVIALPLLILRLNDKKPLALARTDTLAPIAAGLFILFVAGYLQLERIIPPTGAFGYDVAPARLFLAAAWGSVCIMIWALLTGRSREIRPVLQASTPAIFIVALPLFLALVVSVMGGEGANSVTPFANLGMMASFLLVATAGLYAVFLREVRFAVPGLLALLILLITGAVEIIRLAGREPFPVGLPWFFAGSLLLTLWATALALGAWFLFRRFLTTWASRSAYEAVAEGLLVLATGKCVGLDLALPWLLGIQQHGAPLGNLQAFTAASVLGALILAMGWKKSSPSFLRVGWVFTGLLVFLASSIEVARILRTVAASLALANPNFLILAGYSLWWALFALASITLGFLKRSTPLRYIGLTLFGITLLKVVFIDLSDIGQGWRVLSFLALGALLIATSILYAKLAPLLLRDEAKPTDNLL